MALKLYMHPLSSFCWKVLIALYENDTPFEAITVNLADAKERDALARLWPIAKFPVLRDEARGRNVAESSIIIEYLDRNYPGRVAFLPADPDLALQVRMKDRFLDLYVHHPMQAIVGDRLRPAGQKDPLGVQNARAQLRRSCDILESELSSQTWAAGESFTLADCAASPALFYANEVQPFGETHPAVAEYLARLTARPAFSRVLEEAEPFFSFFPRQ